MKSPSVCCLPVLFSARLSHILVTVFLFIGVAILFSFVLILFGSSGQSGNLEYHSSERVPLGCGPWALTYSLEILSHSPELDSMAAVAGLIYGRFFPCLILANRQLL